MQPREAFKLGFLARCVEERLSPAQTQALMKQAAANLEKVSFSYWSLLNPLNIYRQLAGAAGRTADSGRKIVDLAKGSMPLVAATMAVPPALGGLAAYAVNKATDTDATDVEEAKQQELTDTYRRMADELRRQKSLREYKAKRKRTGQVFL